MRTPLKCLPGLKDEREISPAMTISLGHVKDSGLSAEAHVLRYDGAQVGLTLRLLEEVEGAHFGAVIGAGANLDGAVGGELDVAGLAVDDAGEGWRQALLCRQRIDGGVGASKREIGLAAEAPRHARLVDGKNAIADASGLTALDEDCAGKDAVTGIQRAQTAGIAGTDVTEDGRCLDVCVGGNGLDGHARTGIDDAVREVEGEAGERVAGQ